MPYSVQLMRRANISQVTEIDHEAFPGQWPPPNYQQELENQLARYIVTIDNSRTVEVGKHDGFLSSLKNWFNRNDNRTLRPELEEYVVGFAGIWLMVDEAHITAIAVRKEYKRQGIGELLLMSIIDLAQELKARTVTLEVRVSNTPAQQLYYKYGFVNVGTRRAYYTDNREDAMLMSTDDINSSSYLARFQEMKAAYFRKWRTTSRLSLIQAQLGRR